MNQNKTEIVLLTGYLGAGKTTLIKHILTGQNTYKVAIIQNEFADEMGIEAPIIESEGKVFDKFYELPNGCVCCSAKGEFMKAIEFFLVNQPELQYIIVEANGLADPSSLILQFWVDTGLEAPARLHSVICMVASHRGMELSDNEIFLQQLLYADTVVLNYSDKATPEQFKQSSSLINKLNPTCQLLESSYSSVPLDNIFAPIKQPLSQLNKESINESVHVEAGIETLYVQQVCSRTFQEWEQCIGELLWESGMKVLRIKGILQVKDDDMAYQLQGVNDTFEINKTTLEWNNLVDKQSKVLVVGMQLNVQQLQQMLYHV